MEKRNELPPYTLIRSSRRSMAIEIRPGGEVLVRVPKEVSDRAARAFVAGYRDRVMESVERMKAQPRAEEPDAEQIKRLRERAASELPKRAAYWCERLGVKAARVTITSAKKRWGSCSSSGNICFSYLLMRCPDAFIDYVALHEAAHLVHRDHSRAFYALIEQHMPDYRERLKLSGQKGDVS
ncbi:MAG: M48 family peptidase [Clostridia bacterium]|nr:M48 family peptidase [Clostridia bacterium]